MTNSKEILELKSRTIRDLSADFRRKFLAGDFHSARDDLGSLIIHLREAQSLLAGHQLSAARLLEKVLVRFEATVRLNRLKREQAKKIAELLANFAGDLFSGENSPELLTEMEADLVSAGLPLPRDKFSILRVILLALFFGLLIFLCYHFDKILACLENLVH
jgi:hypothetical protein